MRPSNSTFRPAPWLLNPHLQTIYAATLAPCPNPALERVRWETPDGDFIDVDYLTAQHTYPALTPLVVLFHGLEGSSRSHYARSLAQALARRNWRMAIVHFRGCSGAPNRLPRAYHSGDAAEIDWILTRLHVEQRGAPLFATGISLGGNALLKWLGEYARARTDTIAAAAAVSAPLDLVAAGNALDRGFNQLAYTRNFLISLKAKSLAKLGRFENLFDGAAVARATTLRAFDNAFTAPVHGFRDAEDYWTRSSCKPWLTQIRVPTLVLNAADDPFLPAGALPNPNEVAPAVRLDIQAHGGHVGFVTGAFPGSIAWMPERVLDFFAEHLRANRA